MAAFLGPNGAGKTTTMRILSCMLAPSQGGAQVLALDIFRNHIEIKQRIGVIPDKNRLFERLTGEEHLRFVGRLYQMDEEDIERRAPRLLKLFDLSDSANKMIIDYSHGMKKKMALACALLHKPELLILDEPFTGLDPASSRLVKNLFSQLVQEGMTIFFSSHVLEVVERVCSSLVIIDKGRIVVQGPLESLRSGASLEDFFLRVTGNKDEEDLLAWTR